MKEIENWEVHKTFQKLANEGQSTISVRHVVRKKTKQKKIFIKRESLRAVLRILKRKTLENIPHHVAKRILE